MHFFGYPGFHETQSLRLLKTEDISSQHLSIVVRWVPVLEDSLFINSVISLHFDAVSWLVSASLQRLESSWLSKYLNALFQFLNPVEIYIGSLLCSAKILSLSKTQ